MPTRQKTAAKRNLGKALGRTMLTGNVRREFSKFRQIGLWSTLFISGFQLSAFLLYPNPAFARPKSSHQLYQAPHPKRKSLAFIH
jgi:hypothetical protein